MIKPDRYNKVGIQRELRIEWFDKAAQLYTNGLTKRDARLEIYDYLDGAPAFDSPPSTQTKTYIANALIKSWLAPERDLLPLRNDAAKILKAKPNDTLPIHWCLLGAAYPFWFAVAEVVGRLLRLQDQVTQVQIVSRLKERYGDRQTISRRARYVIRSFVAWGALRDSGTAGCYEKTATTDIIEPHLALFVMEAILLANPEARCSLSLLLDNPALYPFKLPAMSGDYIAQHSNRMDVIRYDLNNELVILEPIPSS
jgi:hypothetical protein